MAPEQFAIFKYQHEGATHRSRPRVLFCAVTAMAATLLAIAAFPLGLFALLVPFIGWVSAQKRLFVGPRYLLCGDRILYYANVVRVSQNTKEGTLTLETSKGSQLVLERQRFPTNARKPDKIATNQSAKFSKVSKKIVERVKRAAPDTVRWW